MTDYNRLEKSARFVGYLSGNGNGSGLCFAVRRGMFWEVMGRSPESVDANIYHPGYFNIPLHDIIPKVVPGEQYEFVIKTTVKPVKGKRGR